MTRRGRRRRLLSRRVGRFTWDRRAFALLLAAALFVAGRAWLAEHPEHNPWAPLDLNDPPGWATAAKLRALKGDAAACRSVLARSQVAFSALPSDGAGPCARPDRTRLDAYPFAPDPPPTTCAVAVALELWRRHTLESAARARLGSSVREVRHLGAFSCRRLYGRDTGPWSQHATGNAIDIAGFVLADGRRIGVLRDWPGGGPEAAFLRDVRDGACRSFSTVLGPDYNAAHADHLHLDMGGSAWGGACR